MIRFERTPEPEGFDADVRQRGSAWLAEHPPSARPRPLWSPYLPQLAQGFRNLCAYTAMHIEDGTVDHYLCCATHRPLAYEWSNYRYTSARMNSVKGTVNDRVLDPLEVGDDWFEILLPSLEMRATEHLPPEQRERALFTLQRLGLRDGEKVIRTRKGWYDEFLHGSFSLEGLRRHAPLLARAVEQRLARLDPVAFSESRGDYLRFLGSELTLPGLRRIAPEAGRIVDAELRRPA